MAGDLPGALAPPAVGCHCDHARTFVAVGARCRTIATPIAARAPRRARPARRVRNWKRGAKGADCVAATGAGAPRPRRRSGSRSPAASAGASASTSSSIASASTKSGSRACRVSDSGSWRGRVPAGSTGALARRAGGLGLGGGRLACAARFAVEALAGGRRLLAHSFGQIVSSVTSIAGASRCAGSSSSTTSSP